MNRQLRAARRVRCEQLRYVVIISVRSCQCHRTRSSFQVAAKSRTSRFETTIEDENRDEKMIRTKSNRIEFPFTNGRFESKTTRVQLTRARPHASTCHVGNDALPLPFHRAIPTIGVYFRDLSSLVVDEITRPSSLLRGSIPDSHTHCSHQPRKNPSRDFATRYFPTSSSSFARSLSVTGHSYAIIFRGCSARSVHGLSPMEHVVRRSTPRRSREEEERVARDPRLRNLLHRAIFAPVNFSLQLPSVFSCQVIALSRTKQIFFLPPFFIFLSSRFSFLSSIHDRTTRTKGHTSFSRD